jgi:hypothetical protein
MTIQSITGTEAWCQWFNSKEEVQGKGFEVHMLESDQGSH